MEVRIDFKDLPPLEEWCGHCRGEGKYWKNPDYFRREEEKEPCNTCKGSGTRPSDFGEALLEFIRKFKD